MFNVEKVIESTANTQCGNCLRPIGVGEKVGQLEDVAKGVPGGILCTVCAHIEDEKPKGNKKTPATPPPPPAA